MAKVACGHRCLARGLSQLFLALSGLRCSPASGGHHHSLSGDPLQPPVGMCWNTADSLKPRQTKAAPKLSSQTSLLGTYSSLREVILVSAHIRVINCSVVLLPIPELRTKSLPSGVSMSERYLNKSYFSTCRLRMSCLTIFRMYCYFTILVIAPFN